MCRLPESLAESELFGHTKGAFTGASRNRAGKSELANHGTLFLDEIGELPLSIQPKLLRAIHEGEIQRVGSDESDRVDVRLLAATIRNLEAEVENKRFRIDLYHRLNVYPIRVPSLKEHIEDIPLLADYTGTTVYTVSRTLSSWEKKGWVRSGRERIIVTDPHALVSFSETG